MPETLLSPSNLLLYGRLVQDLAIRRVAHNPAAGPRVGGNALLDAQLGRPDAEFARIYGFSYEGHYYDLAKPALFLVHGPGEIAEERVGAGAPADGAPVTTDRTGVDTQDDAHPQDMRVWSYDKGDFSIRLDIETGPFDQILLDMELEADRRSYAGADVRMRGADVRMRGADVRMRGADVRARTRGSSD